MELSEAHALQFYFHSILEPQEIICYLIHYLQQDKAVVLRNQHLMGWRRNYTVEAFLRLPFFVSANLLNTVFFGGFDFLFRLDLVTGH